MKSFLFSFLTLVAIIFAPSSLRAESPYTIKWEKNILTIFGKNFPGKEMKVNYLEAYCRAGSTDRNWGKTVIGHKTELISQDKNGKNIVLKSTLKDGVTVIHKIRAVEDGIEFRLVAKNGTKKTSEAHWAQPCIRVDQFTARTQKTYLPKSFVFLDGKLARMPTKNWAMKARYIPGQVWCPQGVPRDDVNPRPLSENITSNGLIGCFSADESMLMASVWEPYQELFQGVITCLHSDFRIGGLKPGEEKKIHGKIYLIKNDIEKLLKNYKRDFPEQTKTRKSRQK